MSKPKLENSIYYYTRSLLNGILPLEYAIRAFKENELPKYNELTNINAEIHDFWLSQGFSDQEIKHDLLLDYAWDIIQVGLPLVRTHGRFFFDTKYVSEIQKTLSSLKMKYEYLFISNQYPFISSYRVVDLINGNNIEDLAGKVIKSFDKLGLYEKDDSIPVTDFPLGQFREAVKLYPGMLYQYGAFKVNDHNFFGMGLCLDFAMSLQDIDSAIVEFLYQYGKHREHVQQSDNISHHLINRFLTNDLISVDKTSEVKRLDSILASILGLYCYDKAIQNKKARITQPLNKAIENTIALFPDLHKGIHKSDSIKKYYQEAKKKVQNEWRKAYIS